MSRWNPHPARAFDSPALGIPLIPEHALEVEMLAMAAEVVELRRARDEARDIKSEWAQYYRDKGAAAERARIVAWTETLTFDHTDQMCPNCCTPWTCNGPHVDEDTITWLAGQVIAGAHLPATEPSDG